MNTTYCKPWQHKLPRLAGRALQKRNARIKLRDKHTCQVCKRISRDLQIDHVVPLSKGGSEQDSNLQSLCTTCHEAKTRKEQGCKEILGCDVNGYPIGGWPA